jgi:hypothetical protein
MILQRINDAVDSNPSLDIPSNSANRVGAALWARREFLMPHTRQKPIDIGLEFPVQTGALKLFRAVKTGEIIKKRPESLVKCQR